MQPNPLDTRKDLEGSSSHHANRGAVGILSTSATALQQIAYLLARDGVTVSQVMQAGLHRGTPESGGPAMLEALENLQGDPTTEVITLIAQSPSTGTVRAILRQVRDSDKPTVVCFLGTDQRLVWQAGAIPAGRLDEAAMRAAAWVRGWDQALVSSRLEDQDERLSATAGDLRARLGPGRRGLCGLFSSQAFYGEAQLALSQHYNEDTTNSSPSLSLALTESESQKLLHLQRALGDPNLAVVLLDMVLHTPDGSEPSDLLAAFHRAQSAPIIVTHVCGSAHNLQHAAAQEAQLHAAGIVVAPSNAAAAYLAGSLIGESP